MDPLQPPASSPSKTKLKIISWNINGLKSKRATLLKSIQHDQIDIVLLQETLATAPINISGFQTFSIPAIPSNNAHWGIATLVRKGIMASLVQLPSKLNSHAQALLIRVCLKHETVDILNIYNPCSPYITQHQRKLNIAPFFSLLGKGADHQVIGGDFNLQHSSWGRNNSDSDPGTNLLLDLYASGRHTIMNDRSPTFRSGSSIDLFIISLDLSAKAAWSLYSLYSDHHSMLLTLGLQRVPAPRSAGSFVYDRADWDLLNKSLWDACFNGPPSSCDDLARLTLDAMQDSIPTTSPKFRKSNWASNARTRKAKSVCNSLLHKLRVAPSPSTKPFLKQASDWLEQTCQEATTDSWIKWCSSLNYFTTLSSLWNKFKIIQGSYVAPPLHPDPLTRATELTSQFTSRTNPTLVLPQATLAALAIANADRAACIETQLRVPSPASLDGPLLETELTAVLRNRKKSAPGSDRVPALVWSHLDKRNRLVLLEKLNSVFISANIPQSWRDAVIIPIPKKEKDEFRPISLLQAIGKLLERIVLTRMNHSIFLNNHNFPHQTYGFRPRRSTHQCVLTLVDLINHNHHLKRRLNQSVRTG